jgi:hypothetical protein
MQRSFGLIAYWGEKSQLFVRSGLSAQSSSSVYRNETRRRPLTSDGVFLRTAQLGHSEETYMSITTLLVIVLIVILLGGGGLYGRGRWY